MSGIETELDLGEEMIESSTLDLLSFPGLDGQAQVGRDNVQSLGSAE